MFLLLNLFPHDAESFDDNLCIPF